MQHRYVTLATAAIEQLEAAKVAASCAPAATAAVDPSALLKSDTNMLPKIPSELPSNNSKVGPVSPALENDHVIAEAVDIELSAEAVQLRRKRLEVDVFAVFVLFVIIATELCGYMRAEQTASRALLLQPRNVCFPRSDAERPQEHMPTRTVSPSHSSFSFYFSICAVALCKTWCVAGTEAIGQRSGVAAAAASGRMMSEGE
jgi:hypothetical protein